MGGFGVIKSYSIKRYSFHELALPVSDKTNFNTTDLN